MNTQDSLNPEEAIVQANALLARAQQALSTSVNMPAGLDDATLRPLLLKMAAESSEHGRADQLKRQVANQLALAHQQPGLDSPQLEASPMTVFARQIRRRRTLV